MSESISNGKLLAMRPEQRAVWIRSAPSWLRKALAEIAEAGASWRPQPDLEALARELRAPKHRLDHHADDVADTPANLGFSTHRYRNPVYRDGGWRFDYADGVEHGRHVDLDARKALDA